MTAPHPLSFWLRTLDTQLQNEFAQAAEDAGVDRGQWQVLTRLRAGSVSDEVLVEGLAPFVPADDTVQNVVERAIKDGVVEHRANEYRLTEQGLDRAAQVEEQTLGGLDDRAFAGISPEARETVLVTLERVATNLGWQPA